MLRPFQKNTRRRWLGRPSRRRGAAVVELAIACPVIVLVVMATIDICSMYYLRQTCKIAAYEGCRIALTVKGTDTLLRNQAERVLRSRNVTGYTIETSPGVANLTPGQLLRVTVTAPGSSNLPLGGWLTGGRSISADVVMVSEL